MVSNESCDLLEGQPGMPLDMSLGRDERELVLARGLAEYGGPNQLSNIWLYLSMLGTGDRERENQRLTPIINRLTEKWRNSSSRVKQKVHAVLVSV